MQIIKKMLLSVLFFWPSTLFCVEPITISLALISLAYQTYFAGKDLYYINNPTPEQQVNTLVAQEKLKYAAAEQQLHAIKVEENLEYAQAKNNFRKCLLVSKPEFDRDMYNSPITCKDLASAFIRCGGKAEMMAMVNNFNESYQ